MRVSFGDFTLDSATRQLCRGKTPVRLSPKAFELLLQLTEASPRALAKQEIFNAVWPATFISDSVLAGVVAELRASLGDDARDSRFVRTIYGFGYAFAAQLTRPLAPPSQVRELAWRIVWASREIVLTPGSNILGRGGDSVLWIDDPSVSRHHAAVSIDNADCATIEDLHSKNGTFVNGLRIEAPRQLADRDQVILGRVPMTFRVFHEGTSTESFHQAR